MPSGPSQCDMLRESQEVQARCVWTETTGIGKDANTDNMITCGRGGGTGDMQDTVFECQLPQS